jgi:ribonuclease P protein component
MVPRGAEVSPIRAGFSVPKKKFRKSVQRHRLRRLMVEAWRLNKQEVYQVVPADMQLHLFILYISSEMADCSTVAIAVQKGIEQLKTVLQKQA